MTRKEIGSKMEAWIQQKNAESVRETCTIHTNCIFKKPRDYDLALAEPLRNIWTTIGTIVVKGVFPEIHVGFLTVDVYRLRDTWNDRNINLKQVVLTELRRGYVEFADSKGIPLSAWHSVVITNVWLIKNQLIIEVPCSEFSVSHPHLARILASAEYNAFIEQLNRHSTL